MKINNVSPVVQTAQKTQTQKTFKGNVAQKLEGWTPRKLFELSRQGSMGLNLFIINAFVFLLGSRILTSRDKDEKREILIRDIPTIVLAVAGVPMVENGLAKSLTKKSGVAIANLSEGSPNKAPVSYDQLKDWYTFNNKISTGLKGFSERLTQLGEKVNLKKMYSTLGDNIKGKISGLSDNNAEFIKQITKDKKLETLIKTELSKDGNALLKKAQNLKTLDKSIGFGATLALIGILIPKLNIAITESIHKNKNKQDSEVK